MPKVTITDVFTECQHGLQSHGKLIRSLRKIYDGMDLDGFFDQFIHHLKYSMIVFKREPAVERSLEFAAQFATSLTKQDPTPNENEETPLDSEEENLFLNKLFDFLLKSHGACDKAVRFRSCQMINKLLNNMGDDAQIDDDLYDRIYESMLQRLRDKFPIVRIQAVLAVSRLQDPTDKDCPVINAYLLLMSCDPNPDVRRAVLQSIAASTRTVPAILERTRDVKETTRKLAFQVLSEKVHIKALTIAQRVKLLQDGLNDRTELVKETCNNKLLQAWLRAFGGDVLTLLECLDVENSLDISQQALKAIFQKVPPTELVQNFDLLNDKLVIETEKLSCESVLYWHSLCQYFKSLGDSGEEYLEKILPTTVEFCEYLDSFMSTSKEEENVDNKLKNLFIAQQLLEMTALVDIADEVGRKRLTRLVQDLLTSQHVNHILVTPLVDRLEELQRNDEQRIRTLVEVISDIRQPITIIQNEIGKEEQRQLDLKIASVRVELNQLREELDTCIQQQEFGKAAEIKAKVTELEARKTELMEQEQPQTQEVREEKNDPQTLLKCMTIASEMLQSVGLKTLTPTLQTLIETLILPGVQNEDPAVRNMAVKSLGLCCGISKEAARAHLLLFMQVSQVDQIGVKVTALKVIFDLLHIFGIEAFNVDDKNLSTIEEEEGEEYSSDKDDNSLNESSVSECDVTELVETTRAANETDNKTQVESEPTHKTASSLLSILATLLDSESSEIRTVTAEGLAKLLLSGRVLAPKLLSRLLLLWYNPVTEDDSHLRHCLGTFFPVFAFSGRANQDLVEQAFMPTLKTLFNAPASSPLADVNVTNVAELLVQLTSNKLMIENHSKSMDMRESTIHDNIAVSVSNEILNDPNSFSVRTLCKVLNMLDISPDNESNVKDLHVLTERMLEEVKEKHCVSALEKFNKSIQDMMRKFEKHQKKDTDADENVTVTKDPGATDNEEVYLTADEGLPAEKPQDLSIQAPDGAEDMTRKSISKKSKAKQSVSKKSTSAQAKNNTEKNDENSKSTESDTSVFASPSPVKKKTRGKSKSEPDKAKKNFQEALSEGEHSENETTALKGRTTRSTRNQPLSDVENTVQ